MLILFINGNRYINKKLPIQSAEVERETAMPLILLGNISDINTQVTGARVNE